MAITRIGPNQSINLASNITGTLPTGNGGTGATSFAPGKVLQVVQASDTTSRTTTSSSYATLSSVLTVNITPASTSNKILVVLSVGGMGADAAVTNSKCTVYRGSTDISPGSGLGFGDNNVNASHFYSGAGGCVLDSPNSTSQQTYQFYMKSSGGNTARMNNGSISTLTCYEIKG